MRIIPFLCSILLFSACTTTQTTPILYEKEQLILPPIDIPNFNPVYLSIIILDDEKKYVKISIESYKNMILNNKMIELYIRESTARIDAYIKYYNNK